MKLGEALTVRARMAQKLGDLQARALASTITQEGEEPAEDATELIERYKEESSAFSKLVLDIQTTNVQTTVNGTTIAGLMQQREDLRRQRNIYRAAAGQASTSVYRYSRTEIKQVSTLKAKDLQAEVERLEEEIQAIDTQLQAINWSTDLIA